ncbi:MAG TPA: MerR family transcriptional regulator [Pseudonocardiaceae bacterium]
MLRIGELAELAGVSTRTIRHYHQIGLLPEPVRTANGYRGYQPQDVVLLLRIRRLAETGLRLDEIAGVLAADRAREPRDILLELDTDLAEQERRIRVRRKRIAELLAKQDASTFSDELADLLTNLERPTAHQPGQDRPHLTARMFNVLVNELSATYSRYRTTMPDRALAGRLAELSRAFHQLAGRPPNDPAVANLAHQAARLGPAVLAQVPEPAHMAEPTAQAPVWPTTADPAQTRCRLLLLECLRELP